MQLTGPAGHNNIPPFPGVPDRNHDGRIDRRDLKAIGVASNIKTVRFHINGDGAWTQAPRTGIQED